MPFILLCLLGFLVFFSSYLRIPVLPLYAASLGAGPAQVGSINGAFMLTAGILSIPAGLMADRIGRKLPIVCGVLAIAVSSLLITQCHTALQMACSYALFGAGLAAFAPGMLSLVADVMPSKRLGQAYGWYTTAIYIAMTLGPAAGGFMGKALGLRQVFFVSGGLSLAVALLAPLVLPAGASRGSAAVQSAVGGSVTLLRNRWLVACLLATVGSCIGFGAFLTFLPLHAAARGLDSAHVGIVFGAQALTNVVCRIPIGRVADRLDRRWLVAAGLFSLAVALFAIGQAGELPYLVLCAVCLGVGMALIYTAVGALIAEQAMPTLRGLAMGMYNSSIYLGMMAGAAVLGAVLARVGYPAGFAMAGGVALAAMAGFGLMTRTR